MLPRFKGGECGSTATWQQILSYVLIPNTAPNEFSKQVNKAFQVDRAHVLALGRGTKASIVQSCQERHHH